MDYRCYSYNMQSITNVKVAAFRCITVSLYYFTVYCYHSYEAISRLASFIELNHRAVILLLNYLLGQKIGQMVWNMA